MKKTAVSWLVEQIDNPHTLYWLREVINQAIEMERQQIIDAYLIELLDKSWFLEDKECIKKAEHYYTQTFTEPKND